ncbi:MAG: ribonuclease J [Deltaproteobacteria bacterium]|nr:ribonuclease J [Deltaproteobacteria bacterium]
MTLPDSSIQFIPLGGFGEIGMNCMAICASNQILIIDCGVLFPAEPRLGVDTIHASFDFLLEHEKAIAGLVATHGHEDHIAAIPFLLQKINVPVFAGAYTNGLLRVRFTEFDNLNPTVLTNIYPGKPFQIGPFAIEPLQMPHSTVDNFALLISCSGHRIFHTSDFKLNLHSSNPGQLIKKLESLRPVDVMISDSTGALESSDAGDESALEESIGALVESAPGRVFIALFSSNVRRIRTFIKIAQRTGRKLVMSGKSVLNHYAIARDTGIIPAADGTVIPVQKAHHFSNSELLILMSGTQGESRSALGRFAGGRHAQFNANDTDTVILSSRFIPGNELQISQTISRLMTQGVTVYHSNNRDDIHVSGHGSRNEILAAIEAVRPNALLPAHGTYEHLKATALIAQHAGINSTIIATNGDVVTFANGSLSITDTIDAKKIHIEKNVSIPDEVLRMRRNAGNQGVVALWITIEKSATGDQTVNVRQQSTGVVSDDLFSSSATEIERIVKDTVKENSSSHQDMAQHIKIAVRKLFRQTYKRNPVFMIDVIQNSKQ